MSRFLFREGQLHQFQFRNPNHDPLKFIITTIPPWPGEEEAIFTEDYWK